jgi:hypothetical protein
MKVKFNNGLFDSRIEDGNLILESLTQTFIFEGVGKIMEDSCDHDYWQEGFKHTSRSSFESEWYDNNTQFYVEVYKDEAQPVLDMTKNVN